MLAIIPYEVRTLFQRSPWGNIAVIVTTVIFFLLLVAGTLPDEMIEAMVLDGWAPTGLLGYQLLHGGWWHLIGNMLFLWVFGNAVCGVMNSFAYAGLYAALGVAAGVIHVLCDGALAVGASGALCGIMGVYLAIYPLNRVNCLWWFLIRGGTFGVPGWLLIAFWFALDLWGASDTSSNVAHWAHLGGTVAGFGAGLLLLKLNLIDLFDYDHPTVLGLLQGQRSTS
jgi:membrane associated rhomboid family serine protease